MSHIKSRSVLSMYLLMFAAPPMLRNWSLITGRGGLKDEGGGTRSFTPTKRGGGGKSFSHAEGGAQKVLGEFLGGSLKF